jgi:hypothetical protein
MFYEKGRLRTMLPQAQPAFGSGIGPEETVPRNSCCLECPAVDSTTQPALHLEIIRLPC